MKTKNLILAFAVGGLMLLQASCTTYSYTSRSTRVDQRVINSSEATAELQIDYKKKVTATSDFQKFPGQAKQQAIYQCITNNGIDVLVDPIFQIENRPFVGYRATVLGFAGNYKEGIGGLDEVVEKQYTKEDIEKFLLLTDPEFMQYYYQEESNSGNTYNIKCGTAPVKSGLSLLGAAKGNPIVAAKPAKKWDYKKAKALRDWGIFLSCIGLYPAGIPMACVGAKRMKGK